MKTRSDIPDGTGYTIARDSFLTLAGETHAELKEKHSRFLAFAFPLAAERERAELEAMKRLAALKKEHYTAAHHCHAWRLTPDGSVFKASDDGEPSGTAGRRILGALDRLHLTDAGLIVVRYFGGVKLGVGPLAKAYSDASALALQQAAVVERLVLARFRLSFPYEWTSQAHHALERAGAEISSRGYGEMPDYIVTIRASMGPELLRLLNEFTQRNARIEEIAAADYSSASTT